MIYLKANGAVMAFLPLRLFPRISADNAEVKTLRGNLHSIKRHARRAWDLTISTNDIDDATFDFLVKFYCSEKPEISFNNQDFEQVAIDGGDMPIEYIEDCRLLPQISFLLKRTKANTNKLPGE